MRSISVIFMSRIEAITCLPQIATIQGCEERMGDQWVQRYHHDPTTVPS